jgi:hypothetical protein
MTPEERDIIGQFVARVGGGANGPALPPVDPEADHLLADLFTRYPEARYRITQTAFVHEAALSEAQNRLQRLETEVEQLRQMVAQQSQTPRQGGFLSGIFGGGPRPVAPAYAPVQAPMPQTGYPPSYQPGMFAPGNSGFFGSALKTAAAVAGGVLAVDAISSLFGGHSGFGGGMGGGMGGGFGSPWGGGIGGQGDPWSNPGVGADPSGGDAAWGAAGNSDAGFDNGGSDAGGGGDDWGGGDSGGGDGGGDWGGGGDSSFS